MCLILLAHHVHPRYALVVAANRDEFYERPTAPARFWDDAPDVLAGRDLQGGGTWLGITRGGRFAAVTNYREPGAHRPDARSRGLLVSEFLLGEASPLAYLRGLAPHGSEYNGFSLFVAAGGELGFYSNRLPLPAAADAARALPPGVYGLSNHLLDTPWPKVERGKRALERYLGHAVLSPDELLELLADRSPGEEARLPDTGIGREWERALSPLFVRTERYGTRSSTAVLVDHEGGVDFKERNFDQGSAAGPERAYRFRVRHPP